MLYVIRRTLQNALLSLPLPRCGHRGPEAVEARVVVRKLEPLEVAQVGVEREVEGGGPSSDSLFGFGLLRWGRMNVAFEVGAYLVHGEVRESPFGKARNELDRLVSTTQIVDIVSTDSDIPPNMECSHLRAA